MEQRKPPRIFMKDVINENWLQEKTVQTRNKIAWDKPFISWPIFLAVSIWAILYFTLSQGYTEEPKGVFVFCAVLAIGISAFSLRWRRSYVDKSRELNRHQQLFLQEYKHALKDELLKQMPGEDKILLQTQMRDVQALCQITESKFRDNIIGSRVFVEDDMGSSTTKSAASVKDGTAINTSASENGRLTSTTPTGV